MDTDNLIIALVFASITIVSVFGISCYHESTMAAIKSGYQQVTVVGNATPVWQKVK